MITISFQVKGETYLFHLFSKDDLVRTRFKNIMWCKRPSEFNRRKSDTIRIMYRIFLWDESKQYAVRDLCTFETMEDKNKAEIWRSWSQQKIR